MTIETDLVFDFPAREDAITGVVGPETTFYSMDLVRGFDYVFTIQSGSGNFTIDFQIFDDLDFDIAGVLLNGGIQSIFFRADRTGDYFLGVTPDFFGEGRPYALYGEMSDLQGVTPSGAGDISADEVVSGTLNWWTSNLTRGDADWYEFVPEPEISYSTTLDGLQSNRIAVFDELGNEIVDGFLPAASEPATVAFTRGTDAPVYIEAFGRGSDDGDYTLTIDDSDQQSQGTAAPGTLEVGESVTAMMDTTVDVDWWAVTLDAGVDYTFVLDGLASHTLLLLNSDEVELRDRFTNADTPAVIEFTPAATGTYYLVVDDRDRAIEDYTLAAFETADGPPGNARPIAVGDAVETPADSAPLIDVLANDNDPEGTQLTLDSVGPALFGSVSVEDGQARYTPPTGFSGIDTFIYTVRDADGALASAPVAVTVGAAPTPDRSDGIIRGTGRDDVIAVAQNATYLGREGEDTYILSGVAEPDATSVIEDNGPNTIQLVPGLEVVRSRATPDAVELTLSNGAVIQILNADGYRYEVGGNATSGRTGADLGFASFVADTLGIDGGTGIGGPFIVDGFDMA